MRLTGLENQLGIGTGVGDLSSALALSSRAELDFLEAAQLGSAGGLAREVAADRFGPVARTLRDIDATRLADEVAGLDLVRAGIDVPSAANDLVPETTRIAAATSAHLPSWLDLHEERDGFADRMEALGLSSVPDPDVDSRLGIRLARACEDVGIGAELADGTRDLAHTSRSALDVFRDARPFTSGLTDFPDLDRRLELLGDRAGEIAGILQRSLEAEELIAPDAPPRSPDPEVFPDHEHRERTEREEAKLGALRELASIASASVDLTRAVERRRQRDRYSDGKVNRIRHWVTVGVAGTGAVTSVVALVVSLAVPGGPGPTDAVSPTGAESVLEPLPLVPPAVGGDRIILPVEEQIRALCGAPARC